MVVLRSERWKPGTPRDERERNGYTYPVGDDPLDLLPSETDLRGVITDENGQQVLWRDFSHPPHLLGDRRAWCVCDKGWRMPSSTWRGEDPYNRGQERPEPKLGVCERSPCPDCRPSRRR